MAVSGKHFKYFIGLWLVGQLDVGFFLLSEPDTIWGLIQQDLISIYRVLWEFIVPFNLCKLVYVCLDTDVFQCSKLLFFLILAVAIG